MIEIRIHGRGGQGSVTLAELLAVAAFKDGKFSQAFPKFGPERSGAPVEAYCRIDDKFITIRTQIYEPDYLIVLDDSVLNNALHGLKKSGSIIMNSSKKPKLNFKIYIVDATKIALEILGKPIVNTAMLGAFAKVTKFITLKSIGEAVRERFQGELAENNLALVRRVYDEVRI